MQYFGTSLSRRLLSFLKSELGIHLPIAHRLNAQGIIQDEAALVVKIGGTAMPILVARLAQCVARHVEPLSIFPALSG
jgi:hypothetical protein